MDKLSKLPDLADSLSMKVPSSSIHLVNEGVKSACWKSLLAKGNGAAMSSCRPVSMMFIGLSLAWQLLANGWISDILHTINNYDILNEYLGKNWHLRVNNVYRDFPFAVLDTVRDRLHCVKLLLGFDVSQTASPTFIPVFIEQGDH